MSDVDFNVMMEAGHLPFRVRLTRKEKLGRAMLAIKAMGVADQDLRQEVEEILDPIQKEEELFTDADIRAELYRQGGMLGEEVKPSSARFLRDSLPTGQKKPEEGSRVEYRRLPDYEIWRRHMKECVAKGLDPARGSSVLTRDEAKVFLKKGRLPHKLKRM